MGSNGTTVLIRTAAARGASDDLRVEVPAYERRRLEDVGFMTAMTLTLLGNYQQTGHFGGPLAYTPVQRRPAPGGARERRPVLRLPPPEAPVRRQVPARRRPQHPDPLRPVDRHGRGDGPPATPRPATTASASTPPSPCCPSTAWASAAGRGPCGRCSPTPASTATRSSRRPGCGASARWPGTRRPPTSPTTSTRPSGIGIATAAGKAAFWDFMGAGPSPKVVALEGEFAMTSGHSQELKTQAVAQQVGKRLRILLSYNNAGIDDALVGGVVPESMDGYEVAGQWSPTGGTVLSVEDGNDYDHVLAALRTMEGWDPDDRRPMIVVGRTTKGCGRRRGTAAIPASAPRWWATPAIPTR